MGLTKKLAIGLGGLSLVVLGGGAALLALIDPNDHRARIAEMLATAAGRPVELGQLRLEKSLTPALIAENTVIANAPGGSRPDMARIGRLEVQLRLLPLLLRREVHILRLTIADADILAEEIGGAWNLLPPGPPSPPQPAAAPPQPAAQAPARAPTRIDDLLITNSTLTVRHADKTHHLAITRGESRLAGDGSTLPLRLTGQLDGAPLSLEGTVGLPRPGQDIPVKLSGQAVGIGFSVDGAARSGAARGQVDLKLTDAKALAAITPLPPGLPTPLALQAGLIFDGTTLGVADLRLTAGTQLVTGAATLTLPPGGRPHLQASLATDRLDLDAPPTTGAGPAGGGRRAGRDGRVIPDVPLPLVPALPLDADLDLRIGTLVSGGKQLSDVQAKVTARPDQIALAPGKFTFAGSVFTGELAMRPATRGLRVGLAGQGINLSALAGALGQTAIIAAPADLEINLDGQGASLRPWLASADGHIALTVRGGTVRNGQLDLLAADLLRFLLPGQGGGGETALACLVIRAPVRDGVATLRTALLETRQIAVTAAGTVDLGRELLGLKLTPKPRERALLSLAVRFLVTGSFAHPKAAPDPESLATGAAGALIGLATGGAAGAVVGGLAADGSGSHCAGAIAGQVETPAPRPSTAPPAHRPANPIPVPIPVPAPLRNLFGR